MAVLGIDLGTKTRWWPPSTTVSSVVPDDKGRRLHPSVIHLGPGETDDGARSHGTARR